VPTPDPIPELKAQVARAVTDHLNGWSQVNAGALLRTDQPRVSAFRGGRLERLSLEQLIRLATRVGADITIDITWARKRALAGRRAT
jgi:predicted XRE-type DNA-binding protein